jgi:AraC family transcriptional regulator
LAEIQRSLDEDIDLAALAERFGYSPFHFHRMFTNGVGETPKTHIARLRLEKALLLVVATDETFLDIALATGFQNHETFTRAFKRKFGSAPRDFRRQARSETRDPEDRPEIFSRGSCVLSEATFLKLPPKHFLAARRMGPYAEPFPPPYTEEDVYWTGLVAWAEENDIEHSRLAYGFFPDMPGITPDDAQRSDFCIEIDREVRGDGPYFYAPFAGGEFAMIEHQGDYLSLGQAYFAVVGAVSEVSDRYALNGGAPFQIFREIHAGGDLAANRTEVYFPVDRLR